MRRRHHHDRATSPIADRRDETPLGPCATAVHIFDAVLDNPTGKKHALAVEAAVAVCATCPFEVRKACYRARKDHPGVVAGLTLEQRGGKPERGSLTSRHDDRLDDLRDLIETGAKLPEVCARLGVTRDALWKWCNAHDLRDEWETLSPPRPEAIAKIRRVDPTPEALRKAHAAFARGERTPDVVTGERAYQRLRKQQQRKSAA